MLPNCKIEICNEQNIFIAKLSMQHVQWSCCTLKYSYIKLTCHWVKTQIKGRVYFRIPFVMCK